MASKLVNDRVKEAEMVIAAAETHAAAVAESAQAPALTSLIKDAGAKLSLATREMVEADSAHTTELGDDDEVRIARDGAAELLYSLMVEERSFLSGIFGDEAMPKLGFTRQVPRDATMLSTFSGEVFAALERPLPAPKKKGMSYDPKTDEDMQEAKLAKANLDKALADVKREMREAEATLTRKNRAIDEYDDLFSRTVEFLVGVFRFATQDELADRIRPLVRAPRRAAEPDPSPSQPL